MRRLLLALPLLFGACLDDTRGRLADADAEGDARVDTSDTPRPSDVADVADAADTAPRGRFEGGWIIDQPDHALYEASYYRLEADGGVDLIASTPPNCEGHLERFCETGHVSPPDGDVLCRFGGGRWRELSERELAIVTTCDDGIARDVHLRFEVDPLTLGTAGTTPTIVSVGGEPGWDHASWAWVFRRCEADVEYGFEPARCR